MSTSEPQPQPPPSPAAHAAAPPAAPAAPAPAPRPRRRVWLIATLGLLAVVAAVVGIRWSLFRVNHSITDDAFVEAHLVNLAPELVSGRIVRILVEENDRVERGQMLAEIDPTPFRDAVELARAKVNAADAEERRQEAGLARLRLEVPIQIEIARRTLAAAQANQAGAEATLKLTEDTVAKGIEEASAALDLAKADVVLAQQEFTRFTTLEKEAAVPLRRAQEVTRARDAADAQQKLAGAKQAKAEADRTQIEVARQTVDAAVKTTEKAAKGVEMAETGHAQIHELELLVVVSQQAVGEARRALISAEDQLAYTQIRAPFPGVIVKRFRNLGDSVLPGVAVLSMYDPDALYVEANLEEDRLPGVAPGNSVELRLDAFDEPLRGRVVWINKSTGAQFALMPRNVVSGEFTKVVQRVPVRIKIEKDDHWDQLRAGLSVEATIEHGQGDPEWAKQAAREMADLEAKYNQAAKN